MEIKAEFSDLGTGTGIGFSGPQSVRVGLLAPKALDPTCHQNNAGEITRLLACIALFNFFKYQKRVCLIVCVLILG